MKSHIYIAGISMTRLGKFCNLSVKDLVREAVTGAIADAGCVLDDIEAAWFSNTRQGIMEGQNVIRGQCALRAMGFQGIPITNVENACASSSSALREAYANLKAGLCDVALVVGADKMYFPDKREQMFQAFLGGMDVHETEATQKWIREIVTGLDTEKASQQGISVHSIFMDVYAAVAQLHMRLYGTTRRQIAAAAAKNHCHSTQNPLSQYQQAMSVDEVLGDIPISWPLTRSMCAPISDGAAAAVLYNERGRNRFGGSRAARVEAVALVSGLDRKPEDFDRHIGRRAAVQAYEQAGVGPDEIDVAEVHDACSFAEILQIENMGFCKRGEGGPTTERGETALGGRIPVNPSGGLVSKGHPVAATGLIQLYELVTQLRGEAGSRQVDQAQVALAENGGGFWGGEEAATTVTILVGPDR
ncbi:MAG TPA: thiolase family protein [Candidatus Dormibacteraeota bacterium]|nr:thiolase family protein [Candidatus Dormibacteraeota bacterium]